MGGHSWRQTRTHTKSETHSVGAAHSHTCIYNHAFELLMLSPLYVGVVDSPVVKVVAESRDHQSQDLHITQMVLTGGGRG